MVQDKVAFQAESRSIHRKSDLTTLRSEGFIPGVVYSKGADGVPIQLNEHDFEMMLKNHSGENLMIDLQVGGESPRHVLIKEIQHHPLTSRILHVDFHEISLDRMIQVEVYLEIEGTPVGVTRDGGTLDVQTREIEVECKASDLVESFEVDVSELNIGDHISVGDVSLPEGFTLLTSPEQSVATVLKPRVAADEEAEEEAGAAGEEPEVITEASDDEETSDED